MAWSRREIERYIIPKIFGPMNERKALRLLNFFKVAYFFSASSLAIYTGAKYLEDKRKREDAQAILEGKPVIIDEGPEFERFRLGGYKIGIFRQYDPEKGWTTKEYTREEYLKKLEDEALERAREAQLAALRDTGSLPGGSLVLVDPDEVKS